MKTLVISDIHNHVEWIEDFLSNQKYDKVVFLGDYFDNFGDDFTDVLETSVWLKHSLKFENRVHLFGNHDMSYAFPNNDYLFCPGWSEEKSNAVNSMMSGEDWKKLKLVEFVDGFALSHAGFHPALFRHPMKGMTQEHVLKCCSTAMMEAESRQWSMYLQVGTRMGQHGYGGCIWLDWSEFEPVQEIKQIVGHTPYINVREIDGNYCMDTRNKHVGIIEDGKVNFIEI